MLTEELSKMVMQVQRYIVDILEYLERYQLFLSSELPRKLVILLCAWDSFEQLCFRMNDVEMNHYRQSNLKMYETAVKKACSTLKSRTSFELQFNCLDFSPTSTEDWVASLVKMQQDVREFEECVKKQSESNDYLSMLRFKLVLCSMIPDHVKTMKQSVYADFEDNNGREVLTALCKKVKMLLKKASDKLSDHGYTLPEQFLLQTIEKCNSANN